MATKTLVAPALSLLLEIRPESTYPLPTFMAAFGFTKSSMRAARRRGLRVLYIGKKAFVRGSDAISYIDTFGAEQRPGQCHV